MLGLSVAIPTLKTTITKFSTHRALFGEEGRNIILFKVYILGWGNINQTSTAETINGISALI